MTKVLIIYIATLIYNLAVVIIFSYVVFILDYSGWWFLLALVFCTSVSTSSKNEN